MNRDELLFFYKGWIESIDSNKLKAIFHDLLAECDFEILQFVEHYFQPHGYTCLWLLGESHCAIHTFPENNITFIEVCSCNKPKLLRFEERLKSSNILKMVI